MHIHDSALVEENEADIEERAKAKTLMNRRQGGNIFAFKYYRLSLD
jgi:hypothetical protein